MPRPAALTSKTFSVVSRGGLYFYILICTVDNFGCFNFVYDPSTALESKNEVATSDADPMFDFLFGERYVCYNPSKVQQRLYGVSEDKFVCEKRSVNKVQAIVNISTSNICLNNVKSLLIKTFLI